MVCALHHRTGCEECSGPRDVEFTWRDQNGALQHEKLGKETLELWIMPVHNRESLASELNFHAPEAAELIFAGANVRIYANPPLA
jgi:hypothetical protein